MLLLPRLFLPLHLSLSCVCVRVCVRASILPAFLSISVYVIQGSLAYEVVDIMLQMHTKQSCCHTVSEHKEQVILDTRLSLSPTPPFRQLCTDALRNWSKRTGRYIYIHEIYKLLTQPARKTKLFSKTEHNTS